MSAARVAAWTLLGLLLVAALGAGVLFVPGWLAKNTEPPRQLEPAPPVPTRHIKATLFYVSEDGLRLVPVERDVVFGEGVAEQARHLVEAQLEPAQPPLVSPLPAGTTLRAIYLSERGEAFVDLSPEVSTAHPGGALTELLTVYSLVNTLTTNLPAISAVQILVNGREVDTLAGHVDLRRPLAKSTLLIQEAPGAPAAPVAATPGETPAQAGPPPVAPASTTR